MNGSVGYAELAADLFGAGPGTSGAGMGGPSDTTGQGPGGGGGGGGQPGGGAQATAAVGMAVAAAAGVVGGVVGLATDPREISRVNTKKFTMGLANLEMLEEELKRAKELHDNAVWWLNNPANKKRWMTGGQAMRAAPQGSRICPPLYPRPAYMAATGEEEAPGGHAFGDPGCKCPTHKCAYKPAVRSLVDAKKIVAKETEGRMWRIANSRAGEGYTSDLGLGPLKGNIRDARARTVQAWSLLMSLDSMAGVYALQEIIAPYRHPGLTDPRIMGKLFPQDVDVAEGRIPIFMRDTALATALSLYGGGKISAQFTLPLWTYGFTPAEARSYGVGPLIGQVATVQASQGSRLSGDFPDYQGWGQGPQGGWGELFGADSQNSNLQSTIRQLMETNNMARVRVSPPASIPPAQVQQTADAIAVGENNPDPDKPALPLAAKIGVGGALLGLLGLGAYAAFSK